MKKHLYAYLYFLTSDKKLLDDKQSSFLISEKKNVFDLKRYGQKILNNLQTSQVENIVSNLKQITEQMEIQAEGQINISEQHSQGDNIAQYMLGHTNLILEDLKKYAHSKGDSPKWLLEAIETEDESLQNLLADQTEHQTNSKTNQQDAPIDPERLRNAHATHLAKEKELNGFVEIQQDYQELEQENLDTDDTYTLHAGAVITAKITEVSHYNGHIKFDLGTYTGLLDVEEIDFTNIDPDEDIEYLLKPFSEGQKIRTQIIHVDETNKRVSLSIRKLYDRQYKKVKQGDDVTLKVTDVRKDKLLGRIINTPLIVSMEAHEIARGLVDKLENFVAIGSECKAKVYFHNERNYELGVKCNRYGDEREDESIIELGKWEPFTIA